MIGSIILLVAVLFTIPAYSAQGWYLMVPPKVPTPKGLDRWLTEAPLREWYQNRAFDSAEACERYLDGWKARTTKEFKRVANEENRLFRNGAYLSSCVASDDPRLK
jgi:hypothetical protein